MLCGIRLFAGEPFWESSFSWSPGLRPAMHDVERLKAAGLMELVHELSEQGKVWSDQLAAEPGRYLVSTRASHGVTKLFDKVGPDNVVLAWSMWSGYWERDGCAMREWAARRGVEAHFVHSGGHAWPEDLRRLESTIAPKELVRVHTDCEDPGTLA